MKWGKLLNVLNNINACMKCHTINVIDCDKSKTPKIGIHLFYYSMWNMYHRYAGSCFNFIRCWTHIQNVISISIESTKRKLRWDDNKIWIEKVSNEMNKHERTKHLLNDSFIFHASVEMMESENVRLKQTDAWKIRDNATLMPLILYFSYYKERT